MSQYDQTMKGVNTMTIVFVIGILIYLAIGVFLAIRVLLSGFLDGFKTLFMIVFFWGYLAIRQRM